MAHSRMVWLDGLRLIAGLSMVILHTTADPNGQPWVQHPAEDRVGPIVLHTLAYTARTELFLLIASFLLVMSLNKRPRGYVATIKEQSKRLLLPFGFWTFFYCFYNLLKASYFGYLDAAWADITTVHLWFGHLVLGDIKYHMHFLPTLFGLVLFFPLFRIAYQRPIAGFAVVPLLLIKWELDQQIWSVFWGTDILLFVVRLAKITCYVGYGMAAASLVALWQNTPAPRQRDWLPHIVFFGALLITFKIFASYKTVIEGVWQFDFALGYWANFLMPLILFLICMSLSDKRWPPILSKCSAYSFGIYLCHPIFVDLAEIAVHGHAFSPSMQVLIKLSFALTATPVLVIVITKIPFLAWTVGLGRLPILPAPVTKSFRRSIPYAVNR